MEYPEVEQLKTQFKKYKIKISQGFNHIRKAIFFTSLSIGAKSWDILIDDEFGDFSKHNPVFDWFLVLYALETYDECEDIIEWSNFHGIDTTLLLDYYKSLATTYKEIEAIVGSIDPLISSFDYTLRTSVVGVLASINLE
ncbi:hypothetical protein [Winogradskyella sp.]|uniref:hypothetical protein n=1 Tax=Winogradskyella sp. TaxID=1883156 RepID=UPI002634F976|nr:hypothetical protein [Winogradskyella sp.]